MLGMIYSLIYFSSYFSNIFRFLDQSCVWQECNALSGRMNEYIFTRNVDFESSMDTDLYEIAKVSSSFFKLDVNLFISSRFFVWLFEYIIIDNTNDFWNFFKIPYEF